MDRHECRAALEGLRWRINFWGSLILGGSWLLLYSPIIFFGTHLWWGREWDLWQSEAGPAIITMGALVIGLLLAMFTMQAFIHLYGDKRLQQILEEYRSGKPPRNG